MKKIFYLVILLIIAIVVSIFLYLGQHGSLSLNYEDIPDTVANEICLEVSHSNNVYFCLAAVNQDESYCNNFDMLPDEVLCRAMATRDVTLCRETQESEPKRVCYYETGFVTGEFDYCEEADNPTECYFAFVYRLHWESRADEIEGEYCEKFDENSPDEQIFKNCCLAFKEQDPSLCQGNRYCISFFEQPLSFCDTEFELPGGGLAGDDECLLHRALSSKDSSICAMIESDEGRDMCYADMSTHISPDISFCDMIDDDMIKDMCYTEAAIYISEH